MALGCLFGAVASVVTAYLDALILVAALAAIVPGSLGLTYMTSTGTTGPVEVEVVSAEGGMVSGTVRGTKLQIQASHATTWRRVK